MGIIEGMGAEGKGSEELRGRRALAPTSETKDNNCNIGSRKNAVYFAFLVEICVNSRKDSIPFGYFSNVL